MTIPVVIQYFDGCPSWEAARSSLEKASRQLGVAVEIRLEPVESWAEAEDRHFIGSPTILVDGVDPFAAEASPALACRVYATEAGLAGCPTVEQLVEALRHHVWERPA